MPIPPQKPEYITDEQTAGNGNPDLPAVFSPEDPVSSFSDIGPKRAAALNTLGIFRIADLLYHFPTKWHDRSRISAIADALTAEEATLCGIIESARSIRLRNFQTIAHLIVRDESGIIGAKFFGRGFLVKSSFTPGNRILMTGKIGQYNGPCLDNPEYEVLQSEEDNPLHTGRIIPVYRLTEGLSQRQLRRWVHNALPYIAALKDPLPETTRKRLELLPLHDALQAIHYPETSEQVEKARTRFIFEELICLQLKMLQQRRQFLEKGGTARHRINGPFLKQLGQSLPFTLTAAQDRVIAEILQDMASPHPMLRLVQGDVGCGKTLVAVHAIVAAADGGYQTAFMAPTEILAEQHALTLRSILAPMGIEVGLLTGTTRNNKILRRDLAEGKITVVVGTHALVQNSTLFHRLGLVIIDEQHRFGVVQRTLLAEKGPKPDVLQLSATPIPRTLALTLYGDMDLSIIDELPPGRLPVKTRRIPPAKLPDLYQYIREQAEKGYQAYIVCPIIETSATRTQLTSLLNHFEEISSGPLHGIPAAVLHGKMAANEKEEVMRRFKDGSVKVLFSTTVIEVGVDVPQAAIMVIENAGDFGLTQLHQLRGRVGRGKEQSYCFLTGTPATSDGKERLNILCRCSSGFDLAEEDMKLRGPGELLGVRQAGMGGLRIADLLRDTRLIPIARREAEMILAEYADYKISSPIITNYFLDSYPETLAGIIPNSIPSI